MRPPVALLALESAFAREEARACRLRCYLH